MNSEKIWMNVRIGTWVILLITGWNWWAKEIVVVLRMEELSALRDQVCTVVPSKWARIALFELPVLAYGCMAWFFLTIGIFFGPRVAFSMCSWAGFFRCIVGPYLLMGILGGLILIRIVLYVGLVVTSIFLIAFIALQLVGAFSYAGITWFRHRSSLSENSKENQESTQMNT